MLEFNVSNEDAASVTFDNRAQVDVVERLYFGMSDGYVPNDARFDDDGIDTFGFDYVSVVDGLFVSVDG